MEPFKVTIFHAGNADSQMDHQVGNGFCWKFNQHTGLPQWGPVLDQLGGEPTGKISGIHEETNHEGTNNEGSFMQKFKELGDSMELERIELEIGL